MNQGISKLLETLAKKDRGQMLADASTVLRKEAEYRFPSLHYHQDRIFALKGFLKWSSRRVRSIYNNEDGVALRGEETLRIQELQEAQKRRDREEANETSDRAFALRLAALEAEIADLRATAARRSLAAHIGAARSNGGAAHREG